MDIPCQGTKCMTERKKITIIKGSKYKLKHSNTMSAVCRMAATWNCPLTSAGNI
jgi:hypothetical protein